MYNCPGSPKDTGLVLNCKPFEPMQLTLLTWKWPACLDVFALVQLFCQLMSSNGLISRYKCLTKYLFSVNDRRTATLYMPKIRYRPGPRCGSSRRSPRPPSQLGRGIPPPHTPAPSTRRLDLSVPNFISRKLATPALYGSLDKKLPIRQQAHYYAFKNV